MHRICNKCKLDKPFSEFYIRKAGRLAGKPRSTCKACDKEYRDSNKAYFKKYNQDNLEELKEARRSRYVNNRDEILKANREYQVNNLAAMKAYHKQWCIDNRDHINLRRRVKLKTDPLYRAKHAIRSVVSGSFKRKGFKKNSRTATILGCSIDEFKQHIENQFKPGMTWLNHGDWEIDHRIPLAIAKTEDDVVKLSHYSNLQPLWWRDNLSKGAKLEKPHKTNQARQVNV